MTGARLRAAAGVGVLGRERLDLTLSPRARVVGLQRLPAAQLLQQPLEALQGLGQRLAERGDQAALRIARDVLLGAHEGLLPGRRRWEKRA